MAFTRLNGPTYYNRKELNHLKLVNIIYLQNLLFFVIDFQQFLRKHDKQRLKMQCVKDGKQFSFINKR